MYCGYFQELLNVQLPVQKEIAELLQDKVLKFIHLLLLSIYNNMTFNLSCPPCFLPHNISLLHEALPHPQKPTNQQKIWGMHMNLGRT